MPPRIDRGLLIAQKRQTLREELTVLMGLVEQRHNLTQLKLQLEEVTGLFKEYRTLHEELRMISPESEGLVEMDSIRSDYFRVAGAIKDRSDEELPQADATPNASIINSTMTERRKLLKLPTVPLPTFSGDFNEWLPFINSFKNKIDRDNEIPEGTKFAYLQGCLKGNAASKIAHLVGDDSSYRVAMNLLEESYGKFQVLVFKYIDAIMATDKKRPQTLEELGRVVDELRLNITTLKTLGVNYDSLTAIRYLENALPPKIREDWKRTLDLDVLPTFEQLCKFVNNAIYRYSNAECGPSSPKKRVFNANENRPAKHFKNNKAERSFVTNSDQSKCVVCEGNHRPFACDSFAKLTVQQRWDIVKTKNLCRNCLYENHAFCPSKSRCKKCNRFHHTLLHYSQKVASETPTPARTTGNATQ